MSKPPGIMAPRWERASYISVNGARDDLVLVFDRIVRSFQEEQRQSPMDTQIP